MKKISLLAGLLICILFASCSDPDEITVTLKESGTLTVKVTDNDKKPVKDAKLYVNQKMNSSSYPISDGTTDDNGLWKAGTLLQDTYTIYVTTELNGIKYNEAKTFQIISGENKELEFNPFANVGKIKIYTYQEKYTGSGYNDVPVSGINILLLPYEKYNNSNSLNDYINNADFKGVSGSNGWIEFNGVPCLTDYVIVYYKGTNYSAGWYRTQANKEKEVSLDIEISSYW